MDHREKLIALRDRLERSMDESPPQMLPQIAGQYRATLADIAALDSAAPQVGLEDDLKKKRAQRRELQRKSVPRRNVNK